MICIAFTLFLHTECTFVTNDCAYKMMKYGKTLSISPTTICGTKAYVCKGVYKSIGSVQR